MSAIDDHTLDHPAPTDAVQDLGWGRIFFGHYAPHTRLRRRAWQPGRGSDAIRETSGPGDGIGHE